jgi:mersacidin/lichenicidin family type 2 lantibiotic
MPHRKIIRAWKDEDYRLSLSEAERAVLPGHPAGLVALPDADRALRGSDFAHPYVAPCGLSCPTRERIESFSRACATTGGFVAYESRLLQRS